VPLDSTFKNSCKQTITKKANERILRGKRLEIVRNFASVIAIRAQYEPFHFIFVEIKAAIRLVLANFDRNFAFR
jgi:hypothetical protein